MRNNEIIKIGSVELTEAEALELYESRKYIVTYSRIYQLQYSSAQKRVYGTEIYRQQGMTKRGRFYAMDAESVNDLIGFNLVLKDM